MALTITGGITLGAGLTFTSPSIITGIVPVPVADAAYTHKVGLPAPITLR